MALCLWGIFLLVLSVNLALSRKCPCADPSLCKTISRPPAKEFYMWSVEPWNWRHYDWSKITTIGIFRDWDHETDELLCYAHSKGVRVVLAVDFSLETLDSAEARQEWVKNTTRDAMENFVDGVNIDFESNIAKGSKEVGFLTELVQMTTKSLHENIPGSQVTFDVPFSPNCTYGRCFDYKALADALDFLVLMAYDEPGEIPCIAKPNSPYDLTTRGVQEYIKLQISTDKLVLAVPWYAYDFTCQSVYRPRDICFLNCSHKIYDKIGYWAVQDLLISRTESGRPSWNKTAMSPYFWYNDEYGKVHQVWYDNPESLALKYKYAADNKLRGVGVWTPDKLDYAGYKRTNIQTKEMWDTLRNFELCTGGGKLCV